VNTEGVSNEYFTTAVCKLCTAYEPNEAAEPSLQRVDATDGHIVLYAELCKLVHSFQSILILSLKTLIQ
jgi:hypothetical protein